MEKEMYLLCNSILDETISREMLKAYANSYLSILKPESI